MSDRFGREGEDPELEHALEEHGAELIGDEPEQNGDEEEEGMGEDDGSSDEPLTVTPPAAGTAAVCREALQDLSDRLDLQGQQLADILEQLSGDKDKFQLIVETELELLFSTVKIRYIGPLDDEVDPEFVRETIKKILEKAKGRDPRLPAFGGGIRMGPGKLPFGPREEPTPEPSNEVPIDNE